MKSTLSATLLTFLLLWGRILFSQNAYFFVTCSLYDRSGQVTIADTNYRITVAKCDSINQTIKCRDFHSETIPRSSDQFWVGGLVSSVNPKIKIQTENISSGGSMLVNLDLVLSYAMFLQIDFAKIIFTEGQQYFLTASGFKEENPHSFRYKYESFPCDSYYPGMKHERNQFISNIDSVKNDSLPVLFSFSKNNFKTGDTITVSYSVSKPKYVTSTGVCDNLVLTPLPIIFKKANGDFVRWKKSPDQLDCGLGTILISGSGQISVVIDEPGIYKIAFREGESTLWFSKEITVN